MVTVIQQMKESADQLEGALRTLLLDHSSISEPRNHDSEFVVFINASGDRHWKPLTIPGKRVQATVLERYRHFVSVLGALLIEAPDRTKHELDERTANVLAAITQDGATWKVTPGEVFEQARTALAEQVGLLDEMDAIADVPTAIPDTNALLHNPALETWSLPSAASFEIVLVPAVTSELDALKVNHRNANVRRKAEQLIRQFKEYRRRGSLTAGVVLVNGVSRIVMIAVEPDIDRSLPWLDRTNADDRLLASTLEIMRRRLRSPVFLVTRDINLQNKAEFAGVSFIEPPERRTVIVPLEPKPTRRPARRASQKPKDGK